MDDDHDDDSNNNDDKTNRVNLFLLKVMGVGKRIQKTNEYP